MELLLFYTPSLFTLHFTLLTYILKNRFHQEAVLSTILQLLRRHQCFRLICRHFSAGNRSSMQASAL